MSSGWSILKDIISQSIPASVGSVFFMLLETINIIFIGHLNDPVKVAGVGMGNIIINLFAVGIFTGLNSSLETLVSQAYGAKNLELCGIYLQRGRIINIFVYSIILVLMFLSIKMLNLLNQ
jgi:Na+-driven multidrug efflux pump